MSEFRNRLLALAAVLAVPSAFAADAANGKAVFETKCGICHASSTAPGGPVAGPSMVGLVGRKAASVEGFPMYSPALKASGLTWNPKLLDEFLVNPMAKVPGTMMVISLPDPKERADVIAYLATLKAKK
ncbi:MAG TPA: c-type cytochrome [Steroidobacteraceae bacterium]|nr:c-type cytochrome [Steroidobacteraceae bacterium]